MRVTLSSGVVDAIEQYLSTPWSDGRDPAKIGALNAVAWIGEWVVAAYATTKSASVDWRRVTCRTCGAKQGQNCKAMGGVILPDSARRRVAKPHRQRLASARRGVKP